MSQLVAFRGRTLDVQFTPRARRALARRGAPLVAEMELYFSCLIRKRVVFREPSEATAEQWLGDALGLSFRPVMTRACTVEGTEGPPPTTDFPLSEAVSIVPRWLRIDYRGGQWQGEFGLTSRSDAAA